MSENLLGLLERLGLNAEDLKRGLESGPHPRPSQSNIRDDVPISNNGNGEGDKAGYKAGDRVFDFVQYLSQEDLDLAFEKLGEQDKVMLDQLALEMVRKSKNSAAHVQFSTKMAFEFLAMVGIKMLEAPRKGRTPSAPTNPYGKDVIG